MRVLVLGGSGIIGRELCETTLSVGHRVSTITRRAVSSESQVVGVEYLNADVRNEGELAHALSGAVFDVAVDLLSFLPGHLRRTLDALSGRVHQFIFVSSATIYDGAENESPITEASDRVRGPWQYPLRKIATEDVLRAECAERGLAYTIVRPYITYSHQRVALGPWEGEMLARIAAGIPVYIGDEIANATTSLTHSIDLARAVVGLMGNPAAANGDFNVASEERVTWRQVYELVGYLVGHDDVSLVDGPVSRLTSIFPPLAGKVSDRVRDRVFDISKLRRACPDFEFSATLSEGYSDVIPRYLATSSARLSPTVRGRHDRLVRASRGAGVARPTSPGFDAKQSSSLSVREALGYQVGRWAPLDRFATSARRLLRRDPNRGDYDVG